MVNEITLPAQDTRKRSDHFYAGDGDLLLVSADDVLFKIKRFHLQAAS